MMKFGVTSNLAGVVEGWASVAQDQVPYATAVALTRTAQEAKRAVEAALPSVIDRPTPYTMRGFRLWPATKTKLVAEVDFRDSFGKGSHARDYLAPQVFGGTRKLKAFERSLQRVGLLPAGMAAVPGAAAKIDAYGNMARGQVVQLLSYLRAFGEQGYRSNITQKRKDALSAGVKGKRGMSYFVGRPGGGKKPLGIWLREEFGQLGSSVKPVVLFVKTPTYRKRLDVPGISARVIKERFTPNMHTAMRQAMSTARRPVGPSKIV